MPNPDSPAHDTSRAIALDAATIADLNAAFDAGTLDAEQLVLLCLARIQAYDRHGPRLNAVIVRLKPPVTWIRSVGPLVRGPLCMVSPCC